MNLNDIIELELKKESRIELEKEDSTILVYYVGLNYNKQLKKDEILFRQSKGGNVFHYLIPYIKKINKL